VDGESRKSKTFISQAACLSVRGSGDLFGLPQGRSRADGSEDHRGGPVGGGLKAHGTPWEPYDLARGNPPPAANAGSSSVPRSGDSPGQAVADQPLPQQIGHLLPRHALAEPTQADITTSQVIQLEVTRLFA
jgi:hypothetical protein